MRKHDIKWREAILGHLIGVLLRVSEELDKSRDYSLNAGR